MSHACACGVGLHGGVYGTVSFYTASVCEGPSWMEVGPGQPSLGSVCIARTVEPVG